jgi:hypothetical protein
MKPRKAQALGYVALATAFALTILVAYIVFSSIQQSYLSRGLHPSLIGTVILAAINGGVAGLLFYMGESLQVTSTPWFSYSTRKIDWKALIEHGKKAIITGAGLFVISGLLWKWLVF